MRINLKLLAALAAILLLAAFNSRAQSLIPDPGVPDTVYVDSVGTVATAGQVQVPVNFTNDQNLAGIGLTLTHDLSGLVIDSMSFTGSRLESYSVKGATIVDNWISVYMIVLSEPVLPPGNGLLGTLYLSFSPGIGDQSVTIDTITINQNDVEYNTTFTTEGSDYFYPQFEKGYVSIDGSGCCIDMRGNVNGDVDESVNVSDLTYFVNYLFGGGPAPICYEEADVNADGTLNVADLTFLVNYLFAGGAAPGACP